MTLRTGRKVKRTLYEQAGPEPSESDQLVGLVDTPGLAEEIVTGVNARRKRSNGASLRYTPFLDRHGIRFKDDVPAHVVNIIDSSLAVIEQTIDWGEYRGRKRKPCPEQPLLLTGMPIGQYHCPVCSEMQMAAFPHLPPDRDYEQMTGHEWPPGYEDDP